MPMTSAQPLPRFSALHILSAWGVHLYTASGAIAAFAGTLAVIAGNYREAFLWMIAATFVDATDGVLARRARVKEALPGFDGARLDDIVDYLTYVFLPVLLLYHARDLPGGAPGLVVAAAVLLSSAYAFASADAKTDDSFFTGFPSYWNIVALYLHVATLGTTVERRRAARLRGAGVRADRLCLSVAHARASRAHRRARLRLGCHGDGHGRGHA